TKPYLRRTGLQNRSLAFLASLASCLCLCLTAGPQTAFAAEFNPGIEGFVYSIAMQTDGKILVGGDFSALEQTGNNLLRLNADGTLDGSFAPGPDYSVNSIVVQ